MLIGDSIPSNGFWGSSGSDVFAVGNGGTILRYTDYSKKDFPSVIFYQHFFKKGGKR
jgi:hypothetical protein